MTDTRAHVFVSGTVQGVFYRATTREEARKRGVDGWVKNLADGRVEAVFEGPRTPSRRWSSGATRGATEPASTTWRSVTTSPKGSILSRSGAETTAPTFGPPQLLRGRPNADP